MQLKRNLTQVKTTEFRLHTHAMREDGSCTE